ncbi:hypothetical protein AB1282_23650 [Gottfriedia sp. S16(2024)]|uniref:hypothetical protein n=1 Tax=Gottfriedia sp. S16(2024) TaxID=3162883 RepID=UPI003D1DBC1F
MYSFAICFNSYPRTGVRNRYEYNSVDGLEKNVFTFNEVHLKNFYWRDSSINHHAIIWALAPLMYRDNSEDDYEILVSCLQKVIESYSFLGTDKANMITLFLDYYFKPDDKIVKKIINELTENILEGDEEIMTSIATNIQQVSQVRAKSTMLKNAIQFRFFDGKAIPQYTLNLIELIEDGKKQERVIGEIMSIKDNDPEIISKLNTYLQRSTL